MVENKQNRADLRDKIIAFAMPEFYRRGVKAVKMDEISMALHVSKRTVYKIFGDKEDLLIAGMKMRHEEMKQNVEHFAQTKAGNVIDVISYVYRQQMKLNKMVGMVFYEEIHSMKEGLFRTDVNYEILIDTANACMEEIMHRQFYRKYSMKDLFDHHFFIVIRGFCTARGLALLDKAMEGSEFVEPFQ